MGQDSNRIGSRAPSTLLLCVLLFLVYNSNLRLIRIDDTVPARLLPFCLLLNGNFYLDEWVEPYLPGARGPYGIYFATHYHGHWISTYPVLTPLVVLPLYLFPAWWIAHQNPPLPSGDILQVAVIDVMEKLSASLLATLSVGLLYLGLRRITSPNASLIVALVYGLASNTWTISSQALWKHGLAQLSFSFLLWAIFRSPSARGYSFWAGLALAAAAVNKPPDGLFVLPFLAYLARWHRNKLLPFLTPLFVLGLLLFAYNLHFFGNLFGIYPKPMSPGGQITNVFIHTTFWDGLAGSLLSPNRGLVIYTPWTIFAFWGAARIWKENMFGWGRALIAALVLFILGYAKFSSWWGGWCFGPRSLTDLLPFLALFLIPVWPRIQTTPLLRAAFVLAVAAALWVQVVGAYYYPNGWWDARPVSVDRAPRRLWDWSDTQISRSLRAGPASPQLFYQAYLLFGPR